MLEEVAGTELIFRRRVIERALVAVKILLVGLEYDVVVEGLLVEVFLLAGGEVISDLLLREDRLVVAIGKVLILIALTRAVPSPSHLRTPVVKVIAELYVSEYLRPQSEQASLQPLLLPLHTALQNLARQVPPVNLLDLDCGLHLPLVLALDGGSELAALD